MTKDGATRRLFLFGSAAVGTIGLTGGALAPIWTRCPLSGPYA